MLHGERERGLNCHGTWYVLELMVAPVMAWMALGVGPPPLFLVMLHGELERGLNCRGTRYIRAYGSSSHGLGGLGRWAPLFSVSMLLTFPARVAAPWGA
jgi:hypothetical protein